jgi:hypothetical protein
MPVVLLCDISISPSLTVPFYGAEGAEGVYDSDEINKIRFKGAIFFE